MTITLNVPEDIARHLASQGQDISRAALELMVIEAYREHKLTTEQVHRLLGFESRYELDGFLKAHAVWLDYTTDDLDREAKMTRSVIAKRQNELA